MVGRRTGLAMIVIRVVVDGVVVDALEEVVEGVGDVGESFPDELEGVYLSERFDFDGFAMKVGNVRHQRVALSWSHHPNHTPIVVTQNPVTKKMAVSNISDHLS